MKTLKGIDSVIFDLDGTLWDASEASAVAWNRAIKDLGLEMGEVEPIDIASISGKTPREFVSKIFKNAPPDKSMEWYSLCAQYEMEEIRGGRGLLREGIRDAFEVLSKELPIFLVSNCQRDYMNAFLNWSGLEHMITDSLTHGENGRSKWENLLLLVEKHGLVKPVYVGDTLEDRESALKAGIDFIPIHPAFKDNHRQMGYGFTLDAVLNTIIGGIG